MNINGNWFVLAGSALLLSVGTLAGEPIRLSEPVASDAASETFGAHIDKALEPKTLAQVLQTPDTFLENDFALEVPVKKVCQKKGCFFVAQEGPATIRVEFKDYDFFVPTDIAGKTVTLVGRLKERELSEEDAKHYSNDLGEQGSIRAGLMHEIVASAVRVPKG